MGEPSVRSVAEAICRADPQLPDPDAVVYTDKGAVEAWQTRVEVARAVLQLLRGSSRARTATSRSRSGAFPTRKASRSPEPEFESQ